MSKKFIYLAILQIIPYLLQITFADHIANLIENSCLLLPLNNIWANFRYLHIISFRDHIYNFLSAVIVSHGVQLHYCILLLLSAALHFSHLFKTQVILTQPAISIDTMKKRKARPAFGERLREYDPSSLIAGIVIIGIVSFLLFTNFVLVYAYRWHVGIPYAVAATVLVFFALLGLWMRLTRTEYRDDIPDQMGEMVGELTMEGEASGHLKYNAFLQFNALYNRANAANISESLATELYTAMMDLIESMPEDKVDDAKSRLEKLKKKFEKKGYT